MVYQYYKTQYRITAMPIVYICIRGIKQKSPFLAQIFKYPFSDRFIRFICAEEKKKKEVNAGEGMDFT